jgi:hypothetical protein
MRSGGVSHCGVSETRVNVSPLSRSLIAEDELGNVGGGLENEPVQHRHMTHEWLGVYVLRIGLSTKG